MGDREHVDPVQLEVADLRSVALERASAAVELPAVELHREVRVGPIGIHLESVNEGV